MTEHMDFVKVLQGLFKVCIYLKPWEAIYSTSKLK